MRYSTILGNAFYQIGLPEDKRDYIDLHFTASAHHFQMLRFASNEREREFHLVRHRSHLRELMNIVYLYGDFSKAIDKSLRGLEDRESWNPETNFALPDPCMFDSMSADPSCGLMQPHPSDFYLPFELGRAAINNSIKVVKYYEYRRVS